MNKWAMSNDNQDASFLLFSEELLWYRYNRKSWTHDWLINDVSKTNKTLVIRFWEFSLVKKHLIHDDMCNTTKES